jgi:tetratricopeptide (TPR) repeat protein
LALDLLDEELKNNPTDKLILKTYFKFFYDISDYETALSFYAKNKDILENENDILLKVSEIYLYKHNPERAIQIVSFGLIKFPNFIDFYQIRATSYLMQNDLKLAINDLKKSLKIDKNNLKSLNFLLKLYKQNEDFKNALKIVDKLIILTEENNSLLNQKLILTFKA